MLKNFPRQRHWKSTENTIRICILNLGCITNFSFLVHATYSIKQQHRKGRGRGSGRGKTSGRGHKGQGQRNTKPRLGFEGGQTPLYLRVPKHGFKNMYV